MKYKALSQALATVVTADIVLGLIDKLPTGFAESTIAQFATLTTVYAAWTIYVIGLFTAVIIYLMGRL